MCVCVCMCVYANGSKNSMVNVLWCSKLVRLMCARFVCCHSRRVDVTT